VKKNEMKDEQQNRTQRRLVLSRETVLVLNDPALLGLARGGRWPECNTGSHTHNDDPTTAC